MSKRKLTTRILFKISHVVKKKKDKIRISRLKLMGARIGQNCQIERVEVSFPELLEVGDSCHFENQVRLRSGGQWLGAKIRIGKNTFIGHSTQINVGSSFEIGENCMIAPMCVFSDANHGYNDLKTPMKNQVCRYDSIKIESDVWLGSGVIVLGGVTIGKGAIVAAGALVNKSIPPYEIWGGIPAKKIKSRT